MEPYELIDGCENLVAAFGRWPSFHDAEVYRLALERSVPTGAAPTVEFVVRAWNMSNEVDENGYYLLTHHHLVTFAFEGVTDFKLDGFNHQNVLSGILLEPVKDGPKRGAMRVELEHCFGISAAFIAERGRVVSVLPCDKKGIR